MGRMVYLPTFTINIELNVGKYTSPMNPMGYEMEFVAIRFTKQGSVCCWNIYAFDGIRGLPRSIFDVHLSLEESDKVIAVILKYMYHDVSAPYNFLASNSRNDLFCYTWIVSQIEDTSCYSLIRWGDCQWLFKWVVICSLKEVFLTQRIYGTGLFTYIYL